MSNCLLFFPSTFSVWTAFPSPLSQTNSIPYFKTQSLLLPGPAPSHFSSRTTTPHFPSTHVLPHGSPDLPWSIGLVTGPGAPRRQGPICSPLCHWDFSYIPYLVTMKWMDWSFYQLLLIYQYKQLHYWELAMCQQQVSTHLILKQSLRLVLLLLFHLRNKETSLRSCSSCVIGWTGIWTQELPNSSPINLVRKYERTWEHEISNFCRWPLRKHVFKGENSGHATPKYATLAHWLFWMEGAWETADAPALFYLKIGHKISRERDALHVPGREHPYHQRGSQCQNGSVQTHLLK